jgi:hypothetical protein
MIEAPKALGLQRYMREIKSGEESIITMYPEGYGGTFHTFAFEDEFGPITDPNLLEEIEIIIKHENKSSYLRHKRWKIGGKFPPGKYIARFIRDDSISFEPIQVTEDNPELLVFKAKAENRIFYRGRVIHGLTGKPMPEAIVMKRPFLSDIVDSSLDEEQMKAIEAIGPELVLDDSLFEVLKEDFKSTKMTRTGSNGDFLIALPKKEDSFPGELIAVHKDYLGAKQLLRYMVPVDKDSSKSMRFEQFETDDKGYVKLPVMKLFPAGTIIVEPNVPNCDPMERNEIGFHWQISPEDKTPWLKDFRMTPRESRGGGIFYKNKLLPNCIQNVYVSAGVEQTIKIYRLREKQWAPVVIKNVKLDQGEILNLGRIYFELNFMVAVKVVDSSNEPVEGVAVSGVDENALSLGHKAVTDENGIAMLYVPPHSNGKFVVTYFDESTRKNIQEGIIYETAEREDTGKQFTLQISDEMLYQFFK